MAGNLPWNSVGRPQEETLDEKTLDVQASWKRFPIEQVSTGVIRFSATGIPAQHVLYYSPWQPRDGDVAKGIYLIAPEGVCNFASQGDWWVFCPQLDPNTTAITGIPFIIGAVQAAGSAPNQPPPPPAATALAQNTAQSQGNVPSPGGSMPAFHVENYTLLGTSNTGQAVNLHDFRPPLGFESVFLAPCSNSGHVYITQTRLGFITAAIELCPGTAITLRLQNWNQVWVYGTAGDKLTAYVESYSCYVASSSTTSSSSSSSSSGP